MKHILLALVSLLLALPAIAQETKTIHVMVALCDNKYQGIVKVPTGIGNGQDPRTNLYWGCGYGVSTYFKKSASWQEVKRYKVDDIVLERIVFRHKTKDVYLIADAYNGMNIADCTIDMLRSCAGMQKDVITIDELTLGIYGNAKLVAYVGHNGLMDFSLADTFQNKDGVTRDVMMIGCATRQYFTKHMQSAKANPLLWSTHLMSAEAYTLHDAIDSYLAGGTGADIALSAAKAYHKYQKCGLKGASRLLVSGY